MDGAATNCDGFVVTLAIRLLGRPGFDLPTDAAQGAGSRRSRGHNAWGLLAYLLLHDQAPSRQRLATLLFAEADDPLRAVRWNLAELRRAFGADAQLDGDPVRLHLGEAVCVDVLDLQAGRWRPGSEMPGELLESFAFDACPGFEAWLLVERRRLAALVEAAFVNHIRDAVTAGRLDAAVEFAGRLVELNPLDESHQSLLVQCLAASGVWCSSALSITARRPRAAAIYAPYTGCP